MTNTGGSTTPAGWYNDPAGSGQLRWWDGSAWSGHLAPRPTPAPVPTPVVQQPVAYQPAVVSPDNQPYVPFQGSWNTRSDSGYGADAIEFARPMQWNTAGAWLLGFSQLFFLVILGLFAAVDGAAIAAPRGSDANNGFLYATIGVEIGLWILMLLFAAMDRRKLRSLGYLHTASIWWVLLAPPLIYLIMRGVAVSREVGRGFGPLIAYIVSYVGVIVLAIVAAVAIPVFIAQQGASGTAPSSQFAAGIQKGLDQNGARYTVTCPPSIPTTVGGTFTCTAVDQTGSSHSLKIGIVQGTDGQPTPKLLSVSPPITS